MRRLAASMLMAPALLAGCAERRPGKGTLAELRSVRPDVREAQIEHGLDQAMQGYRRFLEQTPETQMTPEAMRRLADLKIEKQFGIRTGEGKPTAMAVPERAPVATAAAASSAAAPRESDQDFEARTTAENEAGAAPTVSDPTAALEAIALYDKLLTQYPGYEASDKVLYQKARAYDEIGRTDEAMATMERLIATNPHSEHFDEVQYRRGEYFYTRRKFGDAEQAYEAITGRGAGSPYYELALYKLGWTLYKREFYEEALHKYMALLDYKVSIGYDFDQKHEEDDERRVADTFRVISLSFTNLGGPEALSSYFASFGKRGYEDRIYANLGEHYLAKLRYDDAAKTYRAFVALYPFHRAAPHMSMRVVDTFTQGGFPKLVLDSKREFASQYGLKSEYWRHFKPEDTPDVLAYLKANLRDLATHYHAQYQSTADASEKQASYGEALHWYADYLDAFAKDAEAPAINYRLADLHLENKDFGDAARQYERTAYDYGTHAQAAAAGYAAIYAHREQLAGARDEEKDAVKRQTVASSLKFADTFPDDEHAAGILGAAADDLYELKDYPAAIASAQRVLDRYPATTSGIRRSAWIVVAHGSFELAQYAQAETAYAQVLSATPDDDASHAGFVDNLAASIYKQGELANQAQDYRAAADHFLRIRSAAPTSAIRATAEYDAGAALVRLQDWTAAAGVLEAFRSAYPDNPLQHEATRQIAHAYRESGQLARAAGEYDRIASDSDDPALRGEALLVAGDLYEQSGSRDRALDAYTRYVTEFKHPVETALETRGKIAEIQKASHDDTAYRQELAVIVRIDAEAGAERTDRTRTLAARSAMVLAEQSYREFTAVKLSQPFETSLQEKKRRMDSVIESMNALVAYELADVTAAATFYMAETYLDFSRALSSSERPADLPPAEKEAYELALEEEAFPFEEKAIAVHEKNVELLQKGVLNAWTEKSLGTLRELMPGRYKKDEADSGFLTLIDVYVYRPPVSENYGPMLTGAQAPQADPVEVVEHAKPQ